MTTLPFALLQPRMSPAQRGHELMAAERAGTLPRVLAFYGHRPPRGASPAAVGTWSLSQWWPSSFTVQGVTYPTAEHWMMAGKAALFNDPAAAAAISAASSPHVAKVAGRAVKGFDSAAWSAHAFSLVITGTWHKVTANPDLARYLRATGDQILAEASPSDRIWGIGMRAHDPRVHTPSRWNGTNLLGFALMEVRERLTDTS